MGIDIHVIGVGHRINIRNPKKLAQKLSDELKVTIHLIGDYDKCFGVFGKQFYEEAQEEAKRYRLEMPCCDLLKRCLRENQNDPLKVDLDSEDLQEALYNSVLSGDYYKFELYYWDTDIDDVEDIDIYKDVIRIGRYAEGRWSPSICNNTWEADEEYLEKIKAFTNHLNEIMSPIAEKYGCHTLVYYPDTILPGEFIDTCLHMDSKQVLDYILTKQFCKDRHDHDVKNHQRTSKLEKHMQHNKVIILNQLGKDEDWKPFVDNEVGAFVQIINDNSPLNELIK